MALKNVFSTWMLQASTTTTVTSFFIFFRPIPHFSGAGMYLAVINAVIVIETTLGASLWKGASRGMGTIVGALLSYLGDSAYLFLFPVKEGNTIMESPDTFPRIAFWILTLLYILPFGYIRITRPYYLLFGLYGIVATLLVHFEIAFRGPCFTRLVERVMSTLFGIVISTVIVHYLYPTRARPQLRNELAVFYRNFAKLFADVMLVREQGELQFASADKFTACTSSLRANLKKMEPLLDAAAKEFTTKEDMLDPATFPFQKDHLGEAIESGWMLLYHVSGLYYATGFHRLTDFRSRYQLQTGKGVEVRDRKIPVDGASFDSWAAERARILKDMQISVPWSGGAVEEPNSDFYKTSSIGGREAGTYLRRTTQYEDPLIPEASPLLLSLRPRVPSGDGCEISDSPAESRLWRSYSKQNDPQPVELVVETEEGKKNALILSEDDDHGGPVLQSKWTNICTSIPPVSNGPAPNPPLPQITSTPPPVGRNSNVTASPRIRTRRTEILRRVLRNCEKALNLLADSLLDKSSLYQCRLAVTSLEIAIVDAMKTRANMRDWLLREVSDSKRTTDVNTQHNLCKEWDCLEGLSAALVLYIPFVRQLRTSYSCVSRVCGMRDNLPEIISE